MASELIERVKSIRGITVEFTDGSEHVFLTSEECESIIEALQAMEDLETMARYHEEGVSIYHSFSDLRKPDGVWAVDFIGGLIEGNTIPSALRAAAKAIQKGGV